jgi:hypothetical protein
MIVSCNSSFENWETLYPFCSELKVLLFKRLDTMDKNRERLQIDKSNFFWAFFLLILISGIWFQIQSEYWTFFSADWFGKLISFFIPWAYHFNLVILIKKNSILNFQFRFITPSHNYFLTLRFLTCNLAVQKILQFWKKLGQLCGGLSI